ncbi:CDP-diacylglycerol--glycerol-3-phosphate 3-phosphatidyltransferase [Azospirillum sp. TSO22-1]|uniref:CDP-diacylglycerol--glycerol-3-phosphate 3-phosphatidyltransferase n=1 Tax=Azospirillum sp. TSO22-1 TaxID=716789 RepID=UPI000D611BFB|nr:CDP-diacylglycerol--glycerol-3-phosphate 3-phosphatidyltransferase [Azospirillum sp. TSO22-1]PWC37165.1 CDP-diacylglycerol--glycerol-3-phosphate 3-phosphatidyltransferase [Azospirillum sp. TSO22-1]
MLTSLPNLLTLSRIAVIPPVVGLFYVPEAWAAWTICGLFAAACITDYFDGYLARVWEQESVIGKFLDPIADKLLVAAVLIMLVGFGRLTGVSVLAAVVILLREVLVSGLREYLAGLNVGVPVTRLAKWKTTIQMLAIGFLIVGDYGPPEIPSVLIGTLGLWVAALLTFVTGWDYTRVGLRHMMAAPPRRPPHATKTTARSA